MTVLQSMLEQLGINQSIFVMLGIFIVCYLVVGQIALKRLAKYLHERDLRIDGRQHEIHDLKIEAHAVHNKLAEALKAAQREAAHVFAAVKNSAVEEQRSILNAAREKSAAELKSTRSELAKNLGEEMKKVEVEIPQLARQVLDQILGARAGQGN